MRRSACVLALICSLAAVPLANAQSLSGEELQRSKWSSSYESFSGERIRATLVFNGESGSYDTGAGAGELSNVEYKFKLGGGAEIKGNWSFGGSSGTFTFFVAGNSRPPMFSGAWQGAGRSGGWNGRFIEVVQPAGGGGQLGGQFVQQGGGVVYDQVWSYNTGKGYYYKKCAFPAGGYQYIIFYKSKPNWLYWYNPEKQVYWCACPTINHPQWGNDIQNGKDLFLMASVKAGNLEDARFPSAGEDGANFTTGSAKDKDGSTVTLGCPPSDLP
jgi:hypothetical protein